MKKKIIMSLILTAMFVLFSVTDVQAISVDDTKCYDYGCLINDTTTIKISKNHEKFVGSAYKIIDAYYNSTTNEMNYKFTDSFQAFLNSEDDYRNFSIDDYMSLTSDESDNVWEINHHLAPVFTASTLNVLVSKYANYVKVNGVTGISLDHQSLSANVIVGSYLILPSTNNIDNSPDELYSYGLMVANAIYYFSDSEWYLSAVYRITPKYSINYFDYSIIDVSARTFDELANFMDVGFNSYEDFYYLLGNNFSMLLSFSMANVPTNASSAVKNSDMLQAATIDFPSGIDINLDAIFYLKHIYENGEEVDMEASQLTFNNGSCYIDDGTKVGEYSYDSDTNSLAIKGFTGFFSLVISDLSLNSDAVIGNKLVGGALGNPISVTYYYIKDAYALNENDAFSTIDITHTVYTYDLKLHNINGSGDSLNGAVFELYTDSDCTNKIGNDVTISSDGFAVVTGVAPGTYYLKQKKVATGYRLLSTNPMEFTLEVDDLVDDEYFELEVISPAMLLLPFTGGSGTAIYTCFGFLIILVGGVCFYLYNKRKRSKMLS